MKIQTLLKQTEKAFINIGLPLPRLDAEVLLSSLLAIDRASLYTRYNQDITDRELEIYQEWKSQRLQNKPVAYITGHKEFWSLDFEVNNHVLIPRPDTEILVEEALNVSRKYKNLPLKILEIGTGSGAISIALAAELENVHIVAVDISPAALAIASKNARKNKVNEKILFLCGNIYEPITGKFDIVVSNPPYISEEEHKTLAPDIKFYEPRQALVAGKEGTEFYHKLIGMGHQYIRPEGWLIIEIGWRQKTTIESLFRKSKHYCHITSRNDFAGIPRVLRAKRS